MTYNPELCAEKHKHTDEQLAIHDRRLEYLLKMYYTKTNIN